MSALEPAREFNCIANRRTQQQCADVWWQQCQRQLPDDPALAIIEAVKFVHDHRCDLLKVKGLGVQQAIQ